MSCLFVTSQPFGFHRGTLPYRPEIDGLRALAVLPVIFYHAGFSAFSGGFVGVDVFFVISGYLITQILLRDLAAGEFSFAAFYERRARRILPALFFIMMLCLPAAWLWMMPLEMVDFSFSLLATSLFASNLYFWQQEDYFAKSAAEMPLLHGWSLAIEEQFYLLFPLLLYGCWRWLRGYPCIVWGLAVLFAASFVANLWASVAAPMAAFYLLPFRAWELLAGGLTALWVMKQGQGNQPLLAFIGMALLSVAVFALDYTLAYPSYYALLPVLGTVMILAFATSTKGVGKLLYLKPLVMIGLISYSAYLWHQPLFAFARLRFVTEPNLTIMVALTGVSFLLAYASWRWVEQPFRKPVGILRSRRGVFAASLMMIGLFTGIAGLIYHQQGFIGRHPVPPGLFESMRQTPMREPCFQKNIGLDTDDWFCEIGTKARHKDFILFGDSHALAMAEAVDIAAKQQGKSGIFAAMGSCLPFLGVHMLSGGQSNLYCHGLNERVRAYAQTQQIPLILLAARWSYYYQGGYEAERPYYTGTSPDTPMSLENSRTAFKVGLEKTIRSYRQQGTEVVLLRQVPEQRLSPKQLYLPIYSRWDVPTEQVVQEIANHSVSQQDHAALQAFFDRAMQPYLLQGHARVLSFDSWFCGEEHCLMGVPKQSYYHDNNHLSRGGGKRLTPVFEGVFATKPD